MTDSKKIAKYIVVRISVSDLDRFEISLEGTCRAGCGQKTRVPRDERWVGCLTVHRDVAHVPTAAAADVAVAGCSMYIGLNPGFESGPVTFVCLFSELTELLL